MTEREKMLAGIRSMPRSAGARSSASRWTSARTSGSAAARSSSRACASARAVIGAGSVVTRDVPEDVFARREPMSRDSVALIRAPP
jgi:hypothetical protein